MESYRHLGVEFVPTGNANKEIHRRAVEAKATTRVLQKRVLANTNLPKTTRVTVAKACIWTRALRMMGTRERPTAQATKWVYAEIMRPMRAIVGAHKPPRPGEKCMSNAQVRAMFGIPHPEALLMEERLRLVSRVSAHGPPQLLALLQGSGEENWRCEVIKDLRAMKIILHNTLDTLPDPARAPAEWENMWVSYPSQWRSLVQKFQTTAAKSEGDFLNACRSVGVQIPDHDSYEGADEEWMCGDCGKCFSTQAMVWSHRAKMHGYRDPTRLKVAGAICPNCGVDHRSRLRLRRHLHRTQSCLDMVAELPDLAPEQLAEEEAMEAAQTKAAKRAGERPDAGPPCKRPE